MNNSADNTDISLDWGGASLTIEESKIITEGGTNTTVPTKVIFDLGEVSINGSMTKISDSFWAGNATADTDNIHFVFQEYARNIEFTLGKANYSSKTIIGNESENSVDAALTSHLSSMFVKTDFGELSLKNIKTDMSVGNILVDLLETQQKIGQLGWQALLNPNLELAEEESKEAVSQLEEVMQQQLKAGISININELSAENSGGSMNIDSVYVIPSDLDLNEETIQTVLSKAIKGESNFSADYAFLTQFIKSAMSMQGQNLTRDQVDQVLNAQLAQYVQMGLIKQQDGNLHTRITIENDVVTVNGVPITQISTALAKK
nr:DUF945 family protein [Kordiimonas sp. SCSIO 12603]